AGPVTVTVSLPPIVSLSASPSTICSGESSTLTANTSGGTTTAMTYTWYEGAIQLGTTTVNTYPLSALTATADYSVEVVNDNGCSAPASPVTVTVNPLPEVSLLASPSTICSGESTTLTANVSDGTTAAMTYTWYEGAIQLGTTTVNTYPLSALTATADYSVTVLNSNDCSGSATPVTVTVNPLPNVSLSASPSTICFSESTTLTATVLEGSTTAMTYTWYEDAIQLGTTTVNTYPLSALTATANYSVEVLNEHGCSGSATAITVTVNPLPVVSLTTSSPDVCYGDPATLTANVSGGTTTAMTYTWYEGATALGTTTVNNYPLSALTATADYFVEVLNSNGCSETSASETLTVNPLPVVNLATSSPAVCLNQPATLTATVLSGSTPAMTYTWYAGTTTLGSTTVNLYQLSAVTASANYSVEVINSNGCSGSSAPLTLTVSIAVNPQPEVNLSASSTTTCSGDAITLTAAASGGTTTAMTYTWYEGSAQIGTTTLNDYNLSSLSATANYSVEVLNSNGCAQISDPVTVTVNPRPVVDLLASSSAVCRGEAATLTATVPSGSTPAMTYTWFSGATPLGTTTVNVYDLGALTLTADYSVEVLNSYGCSETSAPVTVTVTVVVYDLPEISLSVAPIAICDGESTTLTATVSNGSTPAMTYTWYAGGAQIGTTTLNDYDLSALSATANYSVSVINTNGCSGASAPVTVTVNPLPDVRLSASPSTICFGESTTLTAEVLDGSTAAMTYTWYEGAIALGTTTVNTYPLTSLTATADYSVTVLNSNDCVGSASPVTVTVNPLPDVSLSASSSTICFGESTTLTADILDGSTAAMTYTWYEGTTQLGTTTVNTYPLSALTATADYSVTVLNSNDCSGSASPVTVTVNPLPDVSLSASSSTICFGESTTLIADILDGSTAAMTYTWYEGATQLGTTTVNTYPLSALTATADYSVTVLNSNDCFGSSSPVTVTVNPLPDVSLSASPSTVCYGESTTLTVAVSAGTTTAMTYTWYEGAIALGTTTVNTYSLSSLTATADYSVIVLNSNDCFGSAGPVTVTVNPLPDVSLSASPSTVCFGESTTLTAVVLDGSTAAMTYTWYEGATALGITTVNTYPLSALTATADYSVTVLNSNNCSGSASPVTVTVNPLPEVSLSASPSTICFGESTTLTAEVLDGNTAAMTYTWYEGAIALGTTTVNTYQLSALTATADYSVTVLNSNDCFGSSSPVTVTVNPLPIVSLLTSSPDVCYGDPATLTVDVSGGTTTAMTYTWYEGATQLGTTTVNTYPLSSLTVTADYSVTVLNSNGCSETSTPATITVNLLPVVSLSASSTSVCIGESPILTAEVSGGTTTLMYYIWYENTTSMGVTSVDNFYLSAMAATADYYVEVINNNGCIATSASITITANPLPVVDLSVSSATICFGESTTLTAEVSGGTTTVMTYVWYGSAGLLDTTTENTYPISNLEETSNYYVRVTNSDGCLETSEMLQVTVNPLPDVQLSVSSSTICSGESTTLTAEVLDGSTAAMTYTWYEGTNTLGTTTVNTYSLSALTATADYSVTVLNSNDCSDSAGPVTVTVNPLPEVSLSASASTLCSGESTTLTADVLGGSTAAMTYTWYEGATQLGTTTVNTYPLSALTTTADYSVEVLNENGCSGSATVITVTVNPLPEVSLSASYSTICSDESTTLTADILNGNTAAMTYTWYEGAIQLGTTTVNTYPLSSLTATADYSVIVLNSHGCSSSAGPVTVTVNPLPHLVVSPDVAECYGTTLDISATITNISGTLTWYSDPNYTSAIVTANTMTLTPATTTVYYVEAVSEHNCSVRDSVKVTINPLPVLIISNSNICSGESVTVTASTVDDTDVLNWYEDFLQTQFLGTTSFTIASLTTDTTFYVKATSIHHCVSQGSLSISVAQPPELKAMDDLFVCYGTILTLTTDHYDADNITWNVPQTTFSHTSSSSYVITASRQYCPDVQDTVYITVGDLLHLNPTVLPDFERNRYYEQQLQSNADSPFYTIVSGLLPNGMTLHNDGTIKGVCAFGTYDDQIYTFTVEVTDSNGCSVSNDYSLAGNLFIPVVFSPNNDGVNDHFMKGYRVIIYDRLGRKIFEGDDGWDGTEKDREAPSDAYFYVLRYIDKKGRETHPAGSISLVR
ncbi:MAG: gliding motility-associated C-terminal domain-containing protein, partial [Bacteroidales bacterium]|nr:gliding motility-associated C-terminal domain-containing protein [Bacteroidales bacterium]